MDKTSYLWDNLETMPFHDGRPIDYEVELARCRREISEASEALATGVVIGADGTPEPVSAINAYLWKWDWVEEERLILKEQRESVTQ